VVTVDAPVWPSDCDVWSLPTAAPVVCSLANTGHVRFPTLLAGGDPVRPVVRRRFGGEAIDGTTGS
jgi:hypothetical protein